MEPGVWAPSGRVTGPHRKPILGDLCPEHRAVVNPQLSDLENTDRFIDAEQWMLRATEEPAGPVFFFFFSVAYFCL